MPTKRTQIVQFTSAIELYKRIEFGDVHCILAQLLEQTRVLANLLHTLRSKEDNKHGEDSEAEPEVEVAC